MSDSVDLMSFYGAGVLAGTVERYWHNLGKVGVRVERYQVWPDSDTWGVRSNLINGLPPVFEGVTPLQGEIRVGDTITYPNGRTGTVIY